MPETLVQCMVEGKTFLKEVTRDQNGEDGLRGRRLT